MQLIRCVRRWRVNSPHVLSNLLILVTFIVFGKNKLTLEHFLRLGKNRES